MAKETQEIQVKLTGDSSQMQQAAQQAQKAVQTLGATTQASTQKAAHSTGELRDSMRDAGQAAQQAAEKIKENARQLKEQEAAAKKAEKRMDAFKQAAEKLAEMLMKGVQAAIRTVAERIQAVQEGARDLSVTTTAFQRLQQAARQSGESIQGTSSAVKKVVEQARAAEKGDAAALDAFAQLGISLQELKDKKPEEVINLMASATSALGESLSGPRSANALLQLTGLEAERAASLLREYNEEVENGTQGPVSDEMLDAAREMQEAMESLKDALVYIVDEAGLVGWLKDVAEGMQAIVSVQQRMQEIGAHEDSSAREANRGLPWYKKVGAFAIDHLNPISTLRGYGNWVAEKMGKGQEFFGQTLGKRLMGYQEEGVTVATDPLTKQEIEAAKAKQDARKAERERRRQEREELQKRRETTKAQQEAEKHAAQKEKDASSAYDAAKRVYESARQRLQTADSQVRALESAAKQQREATALQKRQGAVSSASARLASFGFSDGKRGKYADIDASIASKLSQEAAGERVHYTAAERRRMRARERAEEELQDAQKSLARLQKRRADREKAAERAELASARAEQVAAFRDAGAAAMAAASSAPLKELASAVDRLSKQTYIVK